MLNDLTETFVCSVSRAEVNEQIAVALVRLQQDMHSVLTRLNTLEALSVAQTRIRSRTSSENERERQAQVGPQYDLLYKGSLKFERKLYIASRWVHRESNILFTLSSYKGQRNNSLSRSLSVNVNEP